MVKIVVVNGYPGAGKTTFEQCCIERLGENWSKKVSTIDFVKEMANLMGWDGSKTPENRKFLSDLKDLLTHWDNVPYNKIKEQAERIDSYLYNNDLADLHTYYLFVDSREPDEIKKFAEEMDAITVFVEREGGDSIEHSNHADAEVENYDYDYYIHNDGTLDELKEKANIFCYILRKKFK